MTNIVILGASFAGVSAAHRILKEVPKTGRQPVKVVLVSPNTHFYWNIALPRAIIPGLIPDEKLFQPIAAGFKQYSESQFKFIVAAAKSLDLQAKRVHLETLEPKNHDVLDYDFLIIATGTSMKGSTPFKTLSSTGKTKKELHDFQAQVKEAKTIVLAGAGATGVEISGELSSEYGDTKEIILIASGPAILEAAIPGVQKTATRLLHNLKVTTRLNTKVISSTKSSDGRQILKLSKGDDLIADMYIPTFGVMPNSSYIPDTLLNDSGFVIVDDYLKVKGTNNVWAIGDVSDHEPSQYLFATGQAAHMAKNMVLILNNKTPLPYKGGMRGMGLLVGRKTGTGHLGNVKLPGFMVYFLRKNWFLDKLASTVDGSAY